MDKKSRFSEDAEVIGAVVQILTQGNSTKEIQPILEKNKLNDLDPEQWYPVRLVEQSSAEIIAQRQGLAGMFEMVRLGMSASKIENMFPPEISTIEAAFLSMPTGFDAVFRGTDHGYVKVERVGDKHLKTMTRSPFLDDAIYGYYYAVAQHFGQNYNFRLYYDDDALRPDRGGDVLVIHVEWT